MKKHQIFILIALLFVTVLVFYPVLNAGFVNLDDPAMVTENPKIRSLSSENIKTLLFEPHYKLYHPLVTLSYALEYRFFRLDPYFYHAGNLILHLFNTLFVFFIFFRLTDKNFMISFITALIFACHPMHVEPVAWVSGRKDTLYAFFFLSSWLMYLKAYCVTGKKRIFALAFSLFLFLCACLSKTMAVTLPAVLILCDWLTGKTFDKKSIMKYIPFAAVAGIFSLITYLFYYSPGQRAELTAYALSVNFISAHFNVLFYMVKFLMPVKLSVIYPYFFDMNNPVPGYILKSPAMLYGMIFLAAWSIKKTKNIAFGFAFFLITILPVINILPAGVSPAADRYTYIPFIGLGYLAACGIYYLNSIIKHKHIKIIYKFAVAACFIAMCAAAHAKAEKWISTKTLFDDVINNYPGEVAKAYANRGNSYRAGGFKKKAERDFEYALLLEPGNSEAVYDLAILKIEESKYGEALSLYAALPYNDYNIEGVYMYVAKIYYEQNNKEKAYKVIKEGIARFPHVFYLYDTLALFYAYDREYDKAIDNFTKSKRLNPVNEQTYIHLAQIYEILEKYTLAEKEYKEGILRSGGQNAALLRLLGEFYLDLNDYGNASVAFLQSVKKYPSDYKSYYHLGNIERDGHNYKKALYYYTLAISIKNDYAPAYFGRAVAHLVTGNYLKSAQDARKALRAGFDLPEAYIKDLNEKSGISL